ncbi:hypothetical protein [Phenylobacterium sp.]|uniref:hypothetical protein n=1 Tax=Phenylobacterium sp. TaxID=1871053 RepID=UPI003569E6F7
MTELSELQDRLSAAIAEGKPPDYVVMAVTTWERIRAEYAGLTGDPAPTFFRVVGRMVKIAEDVHHPVFGYLDDLAVGKPSPWPT